MIFNDYFERIMSINIMEFGLQTLILKDMSPIQLVECVKDQVQNKQLIKSPCKVGNMRQY